MFDLQKIQKFTVIVTQYVFIALFFALLTFLVVGAYLSFGYIIGQIAKLEAKTFVTLLLTAATALIGLGATLFTQSRIKKRQIEEAHREKKIVIYFSFLETLQRLMLAKNESVDIPELSERELVTAIAKFNLDSSLWGSPQVLNAFQEYRSIKSKNDILAMFKAVDNIYRAMRADIGLSNRGLKEFHFISAYLEDPRELDLLISNAKSLKE